jgi:hypothetical protein
MSKTIYKHKHHIIPRHAGGTDDPSNIIELTVEEHAEAHRLLFEQYGRWQDKVAWKGLSGQIDNKEIIRRLQSEGGKRNKGLKRTAKQNRENSERLTGRKLPEEHCINIGQGHIGITHTEDAKRKISEGNLGKTRSDEQKNNISNSLMGRKLTEEHKRNMSESRSGTGHWMWIAHTYG